MVVYFTAVAYLGGFWLTPPYLRQMCPMTQKCRFQIKTYLLNERALKPREVNILNPRTKSCITGRYARRLGLTKKYNKITISTSRINTFKIQCHIFTKISNIMKMLTKTKLSSYFL